MPFHKRTIRSIPLSRKTILMRADYNVPLREDGTIGDDFRIRASIPTIEYLLSMGCKLVIISHLGRPDGREAKYSLEPVAQHLAHQLKRDVRFVDETITPKAMMAVKSALAGSVVVLENLRFHKEEEENDPEFAAALAKASGADYFVQDGFGVVHRAHASTAAITQYLPSVAGLLLERELTAITDALESPSRPLLAVLGGAKVSDKIGVIERFVDIADKIFIGGAMANTFLNYRGKQMGESKYEPGQDKTLQVIYEKAAKKVGEGQVDSFIVLPTDVATATALSDEAKRNNVGVDELASDDRALDIGDASIELLADVAKDAKTVIWNGTVGCAEYPEFAHGSARLALELASHPEITSIVGGGDTVDFVLHWDSKNGGSFSHVSTGGGASLELIAGKKLPGVESLLDA